MLLMVTPRPKVLATESSKCVSANSAERGRTLAIRMVFLRFVGRRSRFLPAFEHGKSRA